MKHKTFFWFILPSLAAMFVFIALPLVSVVVQSLHIEHEQIIVVTENCGPFGCTEEITVDGHGFVDVPPAHLIDHGVTALRCDGMVTSGRRKYSGCGSAIRPAATSAAARRMRVPAEG